MVNHRRLEDGVDTIVGMFDCAACRLLESEYVQSLDYHYPTPKPEMSRTAGGSP
jgi:hypothetical protein